MKLRIGTFNCENLFSRAALLNVKNNADAKPHLQELVRLQDLLNQPKYSDAAKSSILSLLTTLKGYVNLSELRKKLLGRQKKGSKMVTVVKAAGRPAWEGGVELIRERLPIDAQKSTARVVQAVD